jgi:hypothetical protein
MSSFPELVSSSKLLELLAAGGTSRNQLAEFLGMDPSNVSRWATGKSVPKLRAVHVATRHYFECGKPLTTNPKKKLGRPLTRDTFNLKKAICPHPECIRPNRQMWIAGPAYEHALLGRIVPVYCSGTHTHKHPRVTRSIDRQGRLWDKSDWPEREALSPWELRSLQRARVMMQDRRDQKLLLDTLQRCTKAPSCQARVGLATSVIHAWC